LSPRETKSALHSSRYSRIVSCWPHRTISLHIHFAAYIEGVIDLGSTIVALVLDPG